jgi:flagellar basal-body rod protein FlgC
MTLSSSLGIASQGLEAAAERLQIHANNVANMDTPNYVRKIPVLAENNTPSFESVLADMRNGVLHGGVTATTGGVNMIGYALDQTPGKKFYSPGHPQADKDGYVTMSNVNILADMADATSTSRLYEANLAVLGIVKSMATKALDIGR